MRGQLFAGKQVTTIDLDPTEIDLTEDSTVPPKTGMRKKCLLFLLEAKGFLRYFD